MGAHWVHMVEPLASLACPREPIASAKGCLQAVLPRASHEVGQEPGALSEASQATLGARAEYQPEERDQRSV